MRQGRTSPFVGTGTFRSCEPSARVRAVALHAQVVLKRGHRAVVRLLVLV